MMDSESEIRDPKSEASPNSERPDGLRDDGGESAGPRSDQLRRCTLRVSDLFRISDFGFRISPT